MNLKQLVLSWSYEELITALGDIAVYSGDEARITGTESKEDLEKLVLGNAESGGLSTTNETAFSCKGHEGQCGACVNGVWVSC